MKASKFSDAQKAFILKQGADGIPVVDICLRIPTIAAIDSDRNQPPDPIEASRAFR